MSALAGGQYRTTCSRQTPRGHIQLETEVHADLAEAWRHLARRWLIDTEGIYNTAESRFRVEILGYAHGRPGFRQGAPALRKRAELARDDLFGMARTCGRDWQSLRAQAGAMLEDVVLPEWLRNALDDLAGPSADTVPPLEHWLRPS